MNDGCWTGVRLRLRWELDGGGLLVVARSLRSFVEDICWGEDSGCMADAARESTGGGGGDGFEGSGSSWGLRSCSLSWCLPELRH